MWNSFKYSARQGWDAIARGLKLVYQAATLAEAEERFLEFAEAWGAKYPAIIRHRRTFGPSSCRSSTSIARSAGSCAPRTRSGCLTCIRKAVRARGHFPNKQAALKCVYLAVMAPDPAGKGRARWTQRWKQALNAFDTR